MNLIKTDGANKRILIVGTVDTKSDEIKFIQNCITEMGCDGLIMDVSVLGAPPIKVDYSRHDVAKSANTSNQSIINLGNENDAMIKSAEGAKNLTLKLVRSIFSSSMNLAFFTNSLFTCM